MMTISRWLHRAAAIGCLLTLIAVYDLQATVSAAEAVTEVKAKAAFLYNVVKFVQWPAASDLPSDSIVIGVVSRDSFRRALEDVVKGKTVNGRPLVVRELRGDDVHGCHIVFFEEQADAPRRDAILRAAREAPVLTIGETTRFLFDGGLVRLYVEGERLKFQIDPVGVQLAGLKVSAQLMSLAK